MTSVDVETCERLCDDAFYDLDVRTTPPHLPGPKRRTPVGARRRSQRAPRHRVGRLPGPARHGSARDVHPQRRPAV